MGFLWISFLVYLWDKYSREKGTVIVLFLCVMVI